MASTRELRRRIKSVKTTRQITKAMELVSSSKMRRASDAALASRPYAESLWQLLRDISGRNHYGVSQPLMTPRPIKTTLIITVASDRGLAGSYNANILKRAVEVAKQETVAGHQVQFICLGRRVESGLHRLGYNVVQSYGQFTTAPSSAELGQIGQFAERAFLAGDIDAVILVSTRFYSLLRSEVTAQPLLPLVAPTEQQASPPTHDFAYEPDPATVLAALVPRLVEAQIFQAVVEALAAEHAARRMAMKDATDNASEVIDDLTLTYNSLRQNAITQELAEITSGAAALAE